MPVSVKIGMKKTKSNSALLCDRMEKAIAEAEEQLERHQKIKEELGYEPGLFKQAVEKGVISKENAKIVLDEEKQIRSQIKSDIKADVLREKQRLKMQRKKDKQNPFVASDASPTTTKKKKRRRSAGRMV